MNAKISLGLLLLLPTWLFHVLPAWSQPWRTLGDLRATFPTNTVSHSPDGRFLIAADVSFAARVMVIDAANGQKIRELSGHGRYVNQFAFSADSKFVYTGGHPHGAGYASPDNAVFVWELDSGKRVKEFQAEIWTLTPDGKVLLLAQNHRDFVDNIELGIEPRKPAPPTFNIRFLDTNTWNELGNISDKGIQVSALAISSDGKTAAWAGSDYQIRLVDIESRKEIRKFQAAKSWIQGPKAWVDMTHGITFLAWAPDGKRLASVTDTIINMSNARTINVWDVTSGKEINQLVGPGQCVSGLAYSAKGDHLVVTGRQNQCIVFGMPAGEKIESKSPVRGHADIMLALYRQGKVPAADSPPFQSYLWDLATNRDIESGNTPERMFCLASLPDGRTVVTGEQGGFLRFWDLASGKEIRRVQDTNPRLRKSDTATYGLDYSPADKLLISSHWNGDLKTWNPDDGKLQHVISGGYVHRQLAVARDGKIAAASDGRVQIWPGPAGEPSVIDIKASNIWTMQFSYDCKMLMVATWSGLHLIDVPGKKVLRVIQPEMSFPNAALSPNGKTLATLGRQDRPGYASLEKEIRLWNLETGLQLGKLATDPPPDYGTISFSPDGRSLLVHHPGGMSVWEVESGQRRFTASGRGKGFSPNGRLLFSLTDKQIFVWDLTGQQSGGIIKPANHTAQYRDDLWADMQSNVDASKAYQAMWRLAADAEQTVAFLTRKVGATDPVDVKIVDLNAHPSSPEKLLAGRVVELLEQIGTPDSRRLLESLATPQKPQFTEAARQALTRFALDTSKSVP